jgi:AraC-like DNA-binding protein
MADAATVSGGIAGLVVHTLRAHGGDADGLMGRHGIEEARLWLPDARVPLVEEQRMWEEAADELGDAAFGLHAVYQWKPGDFDVFGYAIASSPTLRDAGHAISRYNRLIHDVAEIQVEEEGDEARFVHWFRTDARGACWHAALFTVASWLAIGRELTGESWPCLGADFQRPEPDDTEEVRAFFDAPLSFGQPRNRLVFPREVLDLPIGGGDAALHRVLTRHAELALSQLPEPDEDRTLHTLRSGLAEALKAGEASMEEMATRLKMSPRTLQRRLKDAGTSFKDVLDEVRRRLATTHLADPRIGIADCAYLLGYSEPSAFQRAFKRWTGTSVGAWRAERAATRP